MLPAEVGWLPEELVVSLFAQSLGTARGVGQARPGRHRGGAPVGLYTVAGMAERGDLYTVDPAVRESLRGTSPVPGALLEGFIDAGQVGRQVKEHLLEVGHVETLALFDHDALHDQPLPPPADGV